MSGETRPGSKTDSPVEKFSLWGNAVSYTAGSFISRLIALFSFPVIIGYLPISDYGRLSVLGSIPPFMALLAIFGQDESVGAFIHRELPKGEKRILISQSLALQVTTIILLVVGAWLIAPALSRVLFGEMVYSDVSLMRACVMQAPFFVIYNFSLNILKWTNCRVRFVATSIGFSLVYSVAIIVLLKVFLLGIKELVISQVVVYAIFSLCGLWSIRSWINYRYIIPRFNELVRFSRPIGIGIVLTAALPIMERSITGAILDMEQLGIYSVALQIAILTTFLSESFHAAWGPYIMLGKGQGGGGKSIGQVLSIYLPGILACVALICSAAFAFINYMAPETSRSADHLVFPIALGFSLLSISKIIETSLIALRAPELTVLGVLARVVVSLSGIVLLSPEFGIEGVAISSCAGCVAQLLATLFISKRHGINTNYSYAAVLLYITPCIMLFLVEEILNKTYSAAAVSFCYAILAVILALVAVARGRRIGSRARLAV